MKQIARRPLCPRCRHSSAGTIKWGEQFARPTTAGNGLLHFAFGSRCITPNKFPSVSLQYAKYPTVGIGVFGIISPPLLCRIFALDRADHRPTRHRKLIASHACMSLRSLRSGTQHDNEDLFVTESFDGIEPRRFPRGVCAENDPTSAHITSAVIIQKNQGVGMSGQYRSKGQP